jgi:flagellin
MAASIINTNVMSLNAQRNLNKNAMSLDTAVQRLSSGLRINSARDDAAGLAIAMSYEADVRGLSVKIRNAADEISAAQTNDGQAAVVTDVLQRMSELSTQATNSTYSAADVAKLQVEYDALNTYQAGLTGSTGAIAGTLGSATVTAIATALGTVASTRAGYGATIAVAEFTVQTHEVDRENTAAARSRIMDADFAMETANLTRGQILVQAGTAMVAQANSIPQNVLSLLR